MRRFIYCSFKPLVRSACEEICGGVVLPLVINVDARLRRTTVREQKMENEKQQPISVTNLMYIRSENFHPRIEKCSHEDESESSKEAETVHRGKRTDQKIVAPSPAGVHTWRVLRSVYR